MGFAMAFRGLLCANMHKYIVLLVIFATVIASAETTQDPLLEFVEDVFFPYTARQPDETPENELVQESVTSSSEGSQQLKHDIVDTRTQVARLKAAGHWKEAISLEKVLVKMDSAVATETEHNERQAKAFLRQQRKQEAQDTSHHPAESYTSATSAG